LHAYLENVACDVSISDTRTQAHCYFVTLDGNKRPRVNDFARFIKNRIIDFAIPRAEIKIARDKFNINGSAAPIVALTEKAKNLFTKIPKSGEGGEVLLSLLAEAFLGLPQLFTKMVLKTSANMHVHGSDGIHVGTNATNGNLAVYWGESKLYKNAASAIKQCFHSLSPFLLDAGGSSATQERDLQLMRDGISIDDPNLLKALQRYLDPDDSKFKHLEYRGLCLVGFDSDSYPTSPNSKELQRVKEEIETSFENNKNQIMTNVKNERIESFIIQVFCIPFPDVEDFRLAFRTELGLNNEQN
jgi:hypothetical protein